MGTLNHEAEEMRFIQTRHEELAAFAACAHAKFTGEVGGCAATRARRRAARSRGPSASRTAQILPDFLYADDAKSLGLAGERIDEPEAIGGAWGRALRADRPMLLEFIIDPEVPPRPPHIGFGRAQGCLSST